MRRRSDISRRAELHRLEPTVTFTGAPPGPGAVDAYVAATRANARVHLALLSNPMARTNWRSVGHHRLAPLVPDARACLETPSVEALDGALNYLMFDRCANVLVINGGDGTIHHTVNAAFRVVERAAAATGRAVPLPRFLFVNGGGMNMLARVFASRGHPVRTLRRFHARARGLAYGALPTRQVPLMRAQLSGEGVRRGYVFGSELVYNALTMYERFGQGYGGLARFLWEVAAGYALNTELWRRYEHLLDAPSTPLVVDGVTHPRYTAVVAATIPLELAKGMIGTVRRAADPGEMHAVCVLSTDKRAVIRTIPRLMRGRPAPGVMYHPSAREIVVHGAYTLDGERVDAPASASEGPVRVRASHDVIRGVWLGG